MTKIKIYLAVITAVSVTVAIGQTPKETRRNLFQDDLPNYKWTKEAWTKTDTPFLKIEDSINSTVSKTEPSEIAKLIPTYRKEAKAHPEDAERQFKWAYSSYKAAREGYYVRSIRSDSQDLSFALAEAKSPQSYVYARLRFLLAMRWKSEDFTLKPLALRLLKRKPNDYDVLYAARNTLQTRASTAERKKALSYSKKLVRLKPQEANSYAALGSIYKDMCIYGDDKAAGDKAIAAYHKFYSMNPKLTKDLNFGIKHWMKRVREHQKELT